MSNYSVHKSEMRSTVRTVLTRLQVESSAILAPDFDNLSENLCVSWSGSGFFCNPCIAPTITSMIPISMRKKEIPIAKKFAVSSTATNTEKTSRNTPVKLVIFVLAVLGCWDKDGSWNTQRS